MGLTGEGTRQSPGQSLPQASAVRGSPRRRPEREGGSAFFRAQSLYGWAQGSALLLSASQFAF